MWTCVRHRFVTIRRRRRRKKSKRTYEQKQIQSVGRSLLYCFLAVVLYYCCCNSTLQVGKQWNKRRIDLGLTYQCRLQQQQQQRRQLKNRRRKSGNKGERQCEFPCHYLIFFVFCCCRVLVVLDVVVFVVGSFGGWLLFSPSASFINLKVIKDLIPIIPCGAPRHTHTHAHIHTYY